MSKVNKRSKSVNDDLLFIENYRAIYKAPVSEIQKRLSRKVSKQYVNRVLRGDYTGGYNNIFIKEIMKVTIDIIKEKQAIAKELEIV